MNGVPFIHLIQSPMGWYFYDVNRHDIVQVSEGAYTALEAILQGKNTAEIDPEAMSEIDYLQSTGYLSDNKIKKSEHPSTKFLPYYLSHKINMLTLQLTQSCNFRCSYCVYSDLHNEANREHSAKRMSFETAKKAVDFLLEHSRDSERVSIGFYGGEPLLEFKLIKKIIEYSDKAFDGKEYSYTITTNGSLLTEQIVAYLAEHRVNTMISLDGPKEIHNISRRFTANGKGSFDTVIENIKMIAEKFPEFASTLGINMVIDPRNDYNYVKQLFDEYDYFDKFNIRVSSSVIDDTYSSEKTIYTDDYRLKRNHDSFLACLGELKYIEKSTGDC